MRRGVWLGERRGNAVDWATQRWVEVTGRPVDVAVDPWLDGPIGDTRGIGPDFFDRWAARERCEVIRSRHGAGLLDSFAALAEPAFDPAAVDRAVVAFYERTTDFDVDVWSEWRGPARPFGWLVAAVFSRRLRQLNLPLSPLDTSHGMTSEIVRVTRPSDGVVRANAWVRTLVKTGRIAYVGSYSIARPPGEAGPCVRTAFPLPNGNAIVLLRPSVGPGGSLTLTSAGRRFGDAGFYFTVRRGDGRISARFVRSFRERIDVYPAADGNGVVRADHTMSLFGRQCLQLHYRLRPAAGR